MIKVKYWTWGAFGLQDPLRIRPELHITLFGKTFEFVL